MKSATDSNSRSIMSFSASISKLIAEYFQSFCAQHLFCGLFIFGLLSLKLPFFLPSLPQASSRLLNLAYLHCIRQKLDPPLQSAHDSQCYGLIFENASKELWIILLTKAETKTFSCERTVSALFLLTDLPPGSVSLLQKIKHKDN